MYAADCQKVHGNCKYDYSALIFFLYFHKGKYFRNYTDMSFDKNQCQP